MPGASGPFNSTPNRGRSPIALILLIILGLGTILFGVLTVVFASSANKATTTLNTQKSAAAAAARIEQQKLDDDIHMKADESPYRAYVAPVEFGSFTINFPKNWSSYVDQEATGKQVQLALHPDFVRRTNGTDDLIATRITLLERTKDQYLTGYASYLKNGTMKKADIKVSGQPGLEFTGKFPDRRTIHEVMVPIRDKVLIFANENAKYSTEFGQIVGQANIIP